MTIFRNLGKTRRFRSSAVACLMFAGCGGSTEQASTLLKPVPVKGSVLYKGKALTGGTVRFEPEDGGREASGNIEPDGTFTLTTFKAADGAVAGKHRVAVDPPADKPKALPAKYKSAASSGIVLDVSIEKTEYVVDLK